MYCGARQHLWGGSKDGSCKWQNYLQFCNAKAQLPHQQQRAIPQPEKGTQNVGATRGLQAQLLHMHVYADQSEDWVRALEKHCVSPPRNTPDVYLVAAKNVDHNQHVGYCNQPRWVSNRKHDVALYFVAKGPVAGKCHCKVAVGNASVGQSHAPHVRLEGAVLDARLSWQRGLHAGTDRHKLMHKLLDFPGNSVSIIPIRLADRTHTVAAPTQHMAYFGSVKCHIELSRVSMHKFPSTLLL